MIRFPATLSGLELAVDRIAPKWRKAAETKTKRFRKAKRYTEKTGSWSKVKQAYIDVQGGKCAYCERQFGFDEKSRIEHDVEHFRPKSSVREWPPADSSLKYDFSTGVESKRGYYLLPYHLLNYIVSCKKCNSVYKSDYFPVCAEKRLLVTDDFDELAAERPLLIYPLAEVDMDPETLITFQGIFPLPAAPGGYRLHRGRVTIDFFDLAGREELLRERAELIKIIFVAYQGRKHRDKDMRRDALQTLGGVENPLLRHRNCARSFLRLCRQHPQSARAHYRTAMDYLESLEKKQRPLPAGQAAG